MASALSLQHQASSASLQSGASLPGQLPVGAEYVEEGGEAPQLTKAQRKNLKRAEKKKKGGHADGPLGAAFGGAASSDSAAAALADGVGSSNAAAGGGSAGSSSGGGAAGSGAAAAAAAPAAAADDADEEATALLYELAVQAMLANKTLSLVASLQRLGFAEWQAAAAVQRNGSDLEEAVAWLLEGGAGPSAEAAAAASSGCVADVSIADELALLEALAAALPAVPRSKVYQAVADAGGDLDAAAAVCLQHAAAAEVEDAVAAAVEDAEAAAAAAAEYGSNAAYQPLLQQQLASGGLDSSGSFANAPSIYRAAAAPASISVLGSQDAAYGSWLANNGASSNSVAVNGISSLGSQQYGQQQQQLLGSGSYGGLASPTVADAAASSFLQGGATAGAAAGSSGLGASSSIWATGEQASNSGSLWGSSGVGGGSGSLFSGLGLGVGTSGLGLTGPSQQQSLTSASPGLSLFGAAGVSNSGSVFGSTSGHDAAAGGAGSLLGGGGSGNGLQQSRLFQSYAYGSSLFGGAEQQQLPAQQQQPQRQASADDEADLEGLMATLMCH
jgi:hypothetical protein